MATVYLAEDLRHDRRVAIKVLRPELAAVIGAERFLAEIKTTANLQHPHILPLHDSGAADSFLFYVMPYVEGESLRDRLTREKQLPIADAITITTEVASALDYAHRHSVIHRDIKPENILLHDGRALVADFGIALAASRAGSGTRMTETGMSLGTPHYMSPEQAMGERDITARSDVYALGAVTYEMLTGEPPFTGPTAQAIVARVMTEAPRNPRLQRQTIPPHVETAVLTALEKLPADRFATAAAYAEALARPGVSVPPSHRAITPLSASRRWLVPAVVIGAAALGAGGGWLLRQPEADYRMQRFRIIHGQASEGGVAVSPDGRTAVAAVTGGDGELGIFVQSLDELDPRPLPGSVGGQLPRFSPDGTNLVYSLPGRIVRQGLDGSAPVTLVQRGSGGLVVEWSDDGYFYVTNLNGAIARVAEAGGAMEDLAVPDSVALGFYGWIDRLPTGNGVVATMITASYAENRIVVLDLETREVRELSRGSMPRYADGHLLYVVQGGTLVAAPFDPGTLEFTGPAVPIARGVWQPGMGRASYDVAGGTLVYQTAPGLAEGRALVVVNRGGERRELPFPRAAYNALAVSPDGRRVAVETVEGVADGGTISTFTLGDSVLTQLTFEGLNSYPAWSADGSRIAFAREVDGERDFWWQPADGTGGAEPIFRRPRAQYEIDFSRDGRWIAFRDGNASSTDSLALWSAPADGSAEPTQFDASDVAARTPAISPDGRWLAYAARNTVFVRPFPDPGSGAVWQVSTGGGQEPVWALSGRELFYKTETHLMAAEVETGVAFKIRGRRELFPITDYLGNAYHQRYAVLPGDTTFVMIQARFGAGDLQTVVVTDWQATLASGRR